MLMRGTVVWVAVALFAGITIGFGLRSPIGNLLNLHAQNDLFPNFGMIGRPPGHICKPPKIWTGNGCADTSSWTAADWRYFWNCLLNGQSQEVCAGKTEAGKGRR